MLSARRIKEIAALKRRRNRDAAGETLVEGVRSVESLLASDHDVRNVVVNARFDVQEYSWLRVFDEIEKVSDRQFERMSDVVHSQGILAVAATRYVGCGDIREDQSVVVLDRLSDPGNAGTIIRSATWFGVDIVLAGEGTVDLYSPKVIRASMGGVWNTGIAKTDELILVLGDLRQKGLAIYAADLEGMPAVLWKPQPTGVLVISSEAHGVRSGIRDLADEVVSIQGARGSSSVESLNAAVSCGILLHRWLGSG